MEFYKFHTLLDVFYIYWKRFPFIRILPAFLAGICAAQFLSGINLFLIMALSFSMLFVGRLLKLNPLKQSFILHLVLFIIGFMASTSSKTEAPIAIESKVTAIATILESIEEKEKTYKTLARLQYSDSNADYRETKSILYIKKSKASKELSIGDKIIIDAQLTTLNQSNLPGQFDYKAFMAKKGIYYSCYLSDSKWQFEAANQKNFQFKQIAEKTRSDLALVIDKHISQSTNGLIKAITLGLKTDLDKTTRTSFSKAGIMHILAVSGLHVGIVWSLLSLLFQPIINFQPKLKATVIILEILLVWVFAFVTGFSPSVQRAAFMFSLFSLSKINQLEKDSLNILAASAVMLLLINTKLLFSVGFQLSYSAMTSIILLYPKIYKCLNVNHKVLDYFWQIQAVSIAAVIGTAPIALFYFHQFSLVFPITNLIAIPIAYLLVSGTILLLMLSKVAILAHLLGQLISGLASFLITTISIISKLKFASLDSLYINSIELLLILLVISTITISLYNFKLAKQSIILGLILLNLLFLYRGGRKTIEYSHQESYYLTHNDYYAYCINVGNKVYTFQNLESSNSFSPELSGYYKAALIYKHENLSAIHDDFKEEYVVNEVQYAQCLP